MVQHTADRGATQMSKPQNKSILYLFMGNEPSTTVRGMAFIPEWKKRGIKANCFFLHSPFILNRLKKRPKNIVWRGLNKIYYLLSRFRLMYSNVCKRYDTIVAVKYIPASLLLSLKSKTPARIIYDFDDAIWLDVFLGEESFKQAVSAAHVVTADNAYLASRAAQYNPHSFVLNGPCQIEQFNVYDENPATQLPDENTVVLGWCGSPSTLFYLYKIYDVLETLGSRYPNIILKLLGTGNDKKLLPPFERIKTITIPWYNQTKMISTVKSFDIGLFPLFRNELSLGRGSLKATIYMAAKVPVIADAMGENLRIIADGENGILATSQKDWINKVSQLIEDKKLRAAIGQKGWEYAMQHYSIVACCEQMINILECPDYSEQPLS
jgi:glycosyltransferase involved in cell wall biosynthesis